MVLVLIRSVASFARPSFFRSGAQISSSSSALDMVRNRGLEVRREGATPSGERMRRRKRSLKIVRGSRVRVIVSCSFCALTFLACFDLPQRAA